MSPPVERTSPMTIPLSGPLRLHGWVLRVATAAAVLGCRPGGPPEPIAVATGTGIVIDGNFEDWIGRGDEVPVAPGTPLERLRITHDAAALYFLIEFRDTVNLQALGDWSARLVLDADGDPATGEALDGLDGVDLQIDLSALEGLAGRYGIMTRLPGDTAWRDSYWIGLRYAPTHAAPRFEMSIERGALPPGGRPLLVGPEVRARITGFDTNGALTAQSPVLAQRLAGHRSFVPDADAAAIDRVPGTSFRILTWNVGDRGMLRDAEPYRRILTALDPDVALLDELHPSLDQAWLERFAAGLPGGPWRVVLGAAGGRQRTAVLSRLQLAAVPGLARIDYPDSLRVLDGLPVSRQMASDLRTAAEDGIPAVGAAVTVNGREVLVMAMDFFCCGRIGGPDDRARIMTAIAIHGAVARALAAGTAEAVVLGGDLNLVGSRRPLDILRRGLDDGRDLAVAPAPRLDGRGNATWAAPSPFPPGRLDYLLVSGSRLEVRRSFAFDPADLTARAQAALGLRPGDGDATDHLPVVADLRWR